MMDWKCENCRALQRKKTEVVKHANNTEEKEERKVKRIFVFRGIRKINIKCGVGREFLMESRFSIGNFFLF